MSVSVQFDNEVGGSGGGVGVGLKEKQQSNNFASGLRSVNPNQVSVQCSSPPPT